MDTNIGGMGKMFKRVLSSESLFVVDYYVNSGVEEVAFASEFPGKIIKLALNPEQQMIVQKDSFMCVEKDAGLPGAAYFRK
jgi:uncharacterized protein (AIM24 family)